MGMGVDVGIGFGAGVKEDRRTKTTYRAKIILTGHCVEIMTCWLGLVECMEMM